MGRLGASWGGLGAAGGAKNIVFSFSFSLLFETSLFSVNMVILDGLEPFLSSLGSILSRLGGILAGLGESWGGLGRSWGGLGEVLGRSWAVLGLSWIGVGAVLDLKGDPQKI